MMNAIKTPVESNAACNANPLASGSYVGEYDAATDIHVVHL
jgi:hypothetical protein